jgi:putative oxidoreductase
MHRIVTVATALNALATRIAERLGWLPPTLARVVVGTVFFQSGWGKLNSLPDVTQFFTELGLPMPAFQAVLASTAEFVCGGLLLAGLATRFAVVPLIITMIVAIRTALWDQVEGVTSLYTLSEFLYITLMVWIGVAGPGPLSLDALLARRSSAPAAANTAQSLARC